MARSDYEKPKIPPTTPPVIDEKASAEDARKKIDADGDNVESGSRSADELAEELSADEIRKANEAISRGKDKDGAGEAELDSMESETLLPPD